MRRPLKMEVIKRLSLIILGLCIVTNFVNSLPVPVKLYGDNPYGPNKDVTEKLEELQRQKQRLETMIKLFEPSVQRTFLEQELDNVNAWIQYIEATSAVSYKDYLEMMEQQRKQLERERALQREQLEHERTVQREQLEREKAIFKEQFEKMADHQKELFSGVLETQLKQREMEMAKISEQFEKETAKHREKYGKEKAERRDQFEKKKTKHKEEFEKENAKQKEQFEKEKNKRKEEYDKEVAKQKENFEKEKNKKREKFDNEKAKQKEQYDKEMEKLREKFEKEEAKQKEQFDKETAKKREVIKKSGQGEQFKKEEAKRQEQFDKEKKKRKEHYEKTKAGLKQKFEKEKSRKKDLFDKEKERQKVKYEKEKNKRKEKFEKEKARQKEQFDKKIAGQKEQFEKDRGRQKEHFDKDISRQYEEFEKVQAELKIQFEKEKEILETMRSERTDLQAMERLERENGPEIGTNRDAVHTESDYQQGNDQLFIEDRKGLKQKLGQILNSRQYGMSGHDYGKVLIPHQEEIDEFRRTVSMGENTIIVQIKLEDLLRTLYEESQLSPEIAYGDFEKQLGEMEKDIINVRDRQLELRSLAEKMKNKDVDDYDEEEIESFRRVDQAVAALNEYLQDVTRRRLYLNGMSQVADLLIECSGAMRDPLRE